MSEASDCRYRADVLGEGESETARCRLVERLSEFIDPPMGPIERVVCETCCRWPAPSPESLNPVVASLLYMRAGEAMGGEGVARGVAEKVARLRRRAEQNLLRVDPTPPARRNEGPCFHLGGRTGLRDCPTCNGSVRLKVFACRHLLHDETTLRECEACPDFDPRLRPDGVKAWAVGVTTAPRARPTLERCLRSLALAGWDAPRLFAEPGVEIAPEFSTLPVSRRGEKLGEWPNWFLGLAELVNRAPDVDAYMMVQDDVVFSRNTRGFLESALWPGPRVGMVSVYCPEPYASENEGWNLIQTRQGMVGALTCIFPSAAARALLAHPDIVNQRQRGAFNGLVDTDGALGRWAHRAGMPVYFHSPSLAQHIGDTSTVWVGAENSGMRRSNQFLGEDFDALRLSRTGNEWTRVEPLALIPIDALTAVPAAPSAAEKNGEATVAEALVDCLGRAEIRLPSAPIRAERCIATVVSPRFTAMLDDLLASLRINGGCRDALVVVFAVDADAECRRVASKHGATLIPCVSRSVVNSTLKSLLYSSARVIDAERFLCLDADTLVLGRLDPVFAALDACPEGSILAAREGNGPVHPNLGRALEVLYRGDVEDLSLLIGESNGEADDPLVVNDGLFAAGRSAMLVLDETIRGWTNAPGWVDERGEIPYRNQFVFNLALAHRKCGVELDPTYNVQLNSQEVEWDVEDGRATALWRGRPARVLHYLGAGRAKDPGWRAFAARESDWPRIGDAWSVAAAGPNAAPRFEWGDSRRGPVRDSNAPVEPPGLGLENIVAAVVVYDRHATISTWLRCWEDSYQGRVPLVVCHTSPGDRVAAASIRLAGPDVYLPMDEEGGQDVAALRRAIRSAPGGWEALFWCTDDLLPMRKDFLHLFAERMTPGVGLVGLHLVAAQDEGPIGPVFEHARTVAFLIRRGAAERLVFPAAAEGKRGCYLFEHADPARNMTAQVRAMGYRVASLHGDAPVAEWWALEDPPMWDVGHAGLQSASAVETCWARFSTEWGVSGMGRRAPRVLVLAHVYYEDLWDEIADHLRRLPVGFDLAVNAVRGRVGPAWESTVREQFPGARVLWSENRGLDVGGTIGLLGDLDLADYDLICKVHTKKSPYDPQTGTQWRRDLLRALFDDPAAVFDAFADPRVAMLSSREHLRDMMTVNRENCVALCRRLGLDLALLDGPFVTGSMFWCRPFVFQALKDAGIGQDEFPVGYERDGTLAHAIERIFGVLARTRGAIVGR